MATELAFETWDVWMALVGVLLLGVAMLPRYVSDRPVSLPMFFVGFGLAVWSLPLGLPDPDPIEHGAVAERLTEIGVIVALMGAGLKIDRSLGFREWGVTWRLLAVAMPLTIASVALLGWWLGGLLVPAAVLLGACIAPTDPVLAGEVELEAPRTSAAEEEAGGEAEDQAAAVNFALTSEASLNDGLAFPYTNLAILFALVGLAPEAWAWHWFSVDVAYRIGVAIALGAVAGWGLGRLVFREAPKSRVAKAVAGSEAVAGTFLIFGVIEWVGAYGFLGLISAALALRRSEKTHGYNEALHKASELAEQVVMAFIMFLFGGAVASGLLEPLWVSWELLAIVGVIVFAVRPLAGAVSLVGNVVPKMGALAMAVVAFFGVRGVATFFYLSHGLEEAPFAGEETLWALAGGVVLTSVVVHGALGAPAAERLEEQDL